MQCKYHVVDCIRCSKIVWHTIHNLTCTCYTSMIIPRGWLHQMFWDCMIYHKQLVTCTCYTSMIIPHDRARVMRSYTRCFKRLISCSYSTCTHNTVSHSTYHKQLVTCTCYTSMIIPHNRARVTRSYTRCFKRLISCTPHVHTTQCPTVQQCMHTYDFIW